MAITTYSELQSAVTQWFDDASLATAQIKECISLCEGELKADLDLLETEVYSTDTASTTSRFVALPANIISTKRVRLIDPTNTDLVYTVEFTTPDGINANYTTESVRPTHVSVNDEQFEFNSIPDKAYTVEILHSRLVPLGDAQTTNEVFPDFANCYLYGALKHAALWAKEDPSLYEKEYALFVKKVKNKNKRKKYPSPLRARARYGK